MPRQEPPLVTQEMIGLFVVFGADLILLVVLLAVVGVVEFSVAAAISGLVLAIYGGWIGSRWYSRRATRQHARSEREETEETPLETLKRRYAAGDLSEAEFERKVDQLLESDRRTDEVEGDKERDRTLDAER